MKRNDTMRENLIHRLADWLLAKLLRFCAEPLRQWGGAMRAELAYIEGDFAAMRWAAGSSLVLLRRMILDRFRPSTPSLAGGMLPLSEGDMYKAARWVALLSVAFSLLFLTAPAFRQALDVTASGWHLRAGFTGREVSQKLLDRIAQEARQRRDPEGLAFAAIQSPNPDQAIRWADEAVAMSPRKSWVYAVVAERNLTGPRAAELIARARKSDPDYAYPCLLEAARLRLIPGGSATDPAWRAAMDAAFNARLYDRSYGLSAEIVTRKAVRDYRVTNPFDLLAVTTDYQQRAIRDSGMRDYARQAFLEPGKKLMAEGKVEEAARLFWKVGSLGAVMMNRSQGARDNQAYTGLLLQDEAFRPLAELARQSGRKDQATMLQLQLSQFQPRRSLGDSARDRMIADAYRWSAAAVFTACAAFLAAALVVLAWAVHEAARRWAPRLRVAPLDGAARVAGLVASVVMFASSVALYVSYQPFALVFAQTQSAPVSLEPLRVFLNFVSVPSGFNRMIGSPSDLDCAVFGVCVVALAVILARRLALTLRPAAR